MKKREYQKLLDKKKKIMEKIGWKEITEEEIERRKSRRQGT